MSMLFQNASEQSAKVCICWTAFQVVRNGFFLSFSQLPVLRIMSVKFGIKLVVTCCFDFVHYLETSCFLHIGDGKRRCATAWHLTVS